MPEEINRIVTDQFADHLFLHSEEAIVNLGREGIEPERMHFVGNTMIDTLLALEERFRGGEAARRLGHCPGEYLLVTLHRPALVDGPLLDEVAASLARVARELPVLFPVHPRTRKMLAARGLEGQLGLIEPVGYLDFLSLEADAAAVLTDSGGVQEETSHLGVPCFTLRDNTERPVTISLGTNTLLGLRPERIAEIPALAAARREPCSPIPFWDGKASRRIGDEIERWLEQKPTRDLAAAAAA
jgi:UDP-N-acetylglucosamine 2-epimerase (non-hydrolysing)